MVYTVRTYLQQRRQEAGSSRSGDRNGMRDEVELALGCLPDETPVFQYQNVAQMEATVHALDPEEIGLCVFIDVPVDTVDRELEDIRFGRITYYSATNILIVKMLSEPHEVAAAWLDQQITLKLAAMGMNPNDWLYFMRASRRCHKEPDSSYRPLKLPAGRSIFWPSVVLEVGYSKGHAALRRDAETWFQRSEGAVKIAITVKISRTKITIIRHNLAGLTRGTCRLSSVQTVIERQGCFCSPNYRQPFHYPVSLAFPPRPGTRAKRSRLPRRRAGDMGPKNMYGQYFR